MNKYPIIWFVGVLVGFSFGVASATFYLSPISKHQIQEIKQEAWFEGYNQKHIDNLPNPGIEKKITRNPNLKLKG